jgi:hypothetical protein
MTWPTLFSIKCWRRLGQVTKNPQHVERAMAIAAIAYLMLLKCRARHVLKKAPQSAFSLKWNFTRQIVQDPIEHCVEQYLSKRLPERNATDQTRVPVVF